MKRAFHAATAVLLVALGSRLAPAQVPRNPAGATRDGMLGTLVRIAPGKIAHRECAPAPLVWKVMGSWTFSCAPDRIWFLTQEKTITGYVVEGAIRRPIEQTRIAFSAPAGDRVRTLAWLQHVSDTEVALLRPGDPRATNPAPALDDSLTPWPNPCGLSFDADPDRPIDLNHNGRPEAVFEQFAAIAGPEAANLVLVEADSLGFPRLVAPVGLVGTIRFDQGVFTSITWPKDSPGPEIQARLLTLYRCRFLALLGLRGRNECDTCCETPIYLHADPQGILQPVYRYDDQKLFIQRQQDDLLLMTEGIPGQPPSTAQLAALARAASFYYLTGTGRLTRRQLEQQLGAEGRDYHFQLLLAKLDRFFLLPQS